MWQFIFQPRMAFYTSMWLFSCLLLAFVFHANGEGPTKDYEMYKRTFQYYDKYIYSRYLDTEKQTCELSKQVIQNLQNMTSTDIWDPLWMMSDDLDKVMKIVKGNNNERCVLEISNSWKDFILQETNLFKRRLESALIDQENQQTFLSEVSKNYTIYMKDVGLCMEECREESSFRLKNCISEGKRQRRVQKGALPSVVITDSASKQERFLRPCMTAFESSVLEYHAERTERIFEEIDKIRTNLGKCGNQAKNSNLTENITTFEVRDPQESLNSIKLAQRLYDHAHNHIWNKLDAFVRLDIRVHHTNDNVSRYLQSTIWKNSRRSGQDYVNAIEQSLNKYPELKMFSKCNVGPDIVSTMADGAMEIETCRRTYNDVVLLNLAEGDEMFNNITKELSEAGNVAILNCIKDPYAFMTNRMEECYILRFSQFNNLWDRVQKEVDDIMEKLNMCLPKKQDVLNPAQICGDLQHQRMLLRASQLLYDYRKCLYLEFGKDYNITLPSASTDPPTPSSAPETHSLTEDSFDRSLFFSTDSS